jgi:hypothetical protein
MDSFLSQRNLLHLQQHKKFGVHAHTFVSQVMAPCEAITLPGAREHEISDRYDVTHA